MSDRSDAWAEAAEYAAAVAGVGEQAARDRGVPVARVDRMNDMLSLLRQSDPDAFYVCINRYATEAAQAVARLVAIRADDEVAKANRPPLGDDDPTDPRMVRVPAEAKGDP